jgi:multiple sugar transport system substrate-binding protein
MVAISAHAETEIRFDAFPDFDSHMKKALPKFHAKHPKIKVKTLMNQHGDHHTKLTNNLATGSGAGDVVAVDVSRLGAFVNAGGFVNLDQKAFQAQKMADKFASFAWAQGKGADGHQYAIPVDLGPGVLFYRRDYVEGLGFKIEDINKDWDSFLEWGEALKKKKKVALIGDAKDIAQLLVFSNVEAGKGIFFNEKGESLLTTPRFVEAVKLAKKVRDKGLDLDITAWTNEWYEALRAGKVGAQLSGAWLLGHLKNWIAPKSAGKWGAANLPDNMYGSWGGSFLAIPKQSEHPEAAWEFMQFLVSPEIQLDALDNIAAFPARVDTYDHPSFNEPIEYLNGQKARQLFAEIARNIKPIKPFKGDQIARTIFMNALEEAVDQGQDAKEVLERADKMLTRRARRL